MCTDGDFNVGMQRDGLLEDFIANKAESGVFLTILGFGMAITKTVLWSACPIEVMGIIFTSIL